MEMDRAGSHPADAELTPTAHAVSVRRTARYYLLGVPGPAVNEVWLVLHGYGQLAGLFLQGFAGLARPDRLIVAPEGLSRFYLDAPVGGRHPPERVGASWMTAESAPSEVDDYIAYLNEVHARVLRGCGGANVLRLLGFSQGAATASRWAVLGSAPPVSQLVLWAGLVPKTLTSQTLRARLAGVPVRLVAGEDDKYVSGDALEAQGRELAELGIQATVTRFAGGHVLDSDLLRSLLEAPVSPAGDSQA